MNILIVDDEISAIEAVSNGVQWAMLEVKNVYTATNKNEAIRRMNTTPIHLLLSDIEMPKGSGLELLTWTNEHYPHVRCVFMTCHADFKYVQEAIRLGSVDYILKPLDFAKVTLVLEQTLLKIRTEQAVKENSNSWIVNKKFMIQQFWKDFFLGEISPNKDSLSNYFNLKRLEISLDCHYLPLLIVSKKWLEPISKEDQKLLQYGLRNITEELFVVKGAEREIIPFSENSILIILQIQMNSDLLELNEQINNCCQQLITAAKKYVKDSVCCYIGVQNTIYEMPAIIESLQEMDFNNVIYEPNVYRVDHLSKSNELMIYPYHPVAQWREWLLMGMYDKILFEIQEILLQRQLKESINRDFLRKFSGEFYYLIFAFASDRNVFVNELLNDEESNSLMQKSSESLEGMLQWIRHVMHLMQSFDELNTNRDQPVARTIQYIHQHLADEITMEHIAKNVHLNADYLTRLFKKETGLSISKFIINKKMEKAKELLIHTRKSIGEIAMLVGYYNYSSFNRIFTKETGMSPQEYKTGAAKEPLR